ncbi:MAG: Rnf-Nqr domain containing protein [Gammaproteobacteria bacterium]|nr:Rnf-Nqr domain containing protein [Gammaproteobacteria bacterium]
MSELDQRVMQATDLWRNNPVLVQMLGLSPVLAVSTTAVNGLGLGIATLVTLVFSSITAFLLRQFISDTWRFVWYLLILATYTTLVDTFMQWQFFPLYRELGIYVPLISCNIAIIVQLEKHCTEQRLSTCLSEATRMGAGFVLVLLVLAGLRELLAGGTLLHDWQLLMPSNAIDGPNLVPDNQTMKPFRIIGMQPGALFVLGLLIAGKNWLDHRLGRGEQLDETTIDPAQRARLTD